MGTAVIILMLLALVVALHSVPELRVGALCVGGGCVGWMVAPEAVMGLLGVLAWVVVIGLAVRFLLRGLVGGWR